MLTKKALFSQLIAQDGDPLNFWVTIFLYANDKHS